MLRQVLQSSRVRSGQLLTTMLAVVFVFAGCASNGGATSAGGASREFVGTVTRHDPGHHQFELVEDTQTGSELGQGSTTLVHYDPGSGIDIAALNPGHRLLVDTVDDASSRHQARSVTVLYAPEQALPWGRYLHGTIGSLNHASNTVTVIQSGSRISVRVKYTDDTQAFSLDGAPLPISGLGVGDELDIVLRLADPDAFALRVVRIR